MKNRIAYMPFSSIPPNTIFLAKNILVLFDETQEANKVIKRIAIINDKANKGLIIDDLQQIGIIDVANKQDGYGKAMWYPVAKIGLFRKLSVEKLVENGVISDAGLKNAISIICVAEKTNDNAGVAASDVLLIAKSYIERFPLSNPEGQ